MVFRSASSSAENSVRSRAAPTATAYTESIIYDFAGGLDGYGSGDVVIDRLGSPYGTSGPPPGANGGMVYKLTPTSTGYKETILYTFTYTFTATGDGIYPQGLLLYRHTGIIVGTTSGGAHGDGTVFALR